MSKIVELAAYKCPAGSMAIHAKHGLVDVFETDGWMRGVMYEHREELGLDGESDEVLFKEEIEYREAWVHVRELVQADLMRDVESLVKRGQLIS